MDQQELLSLYRTYILGCITANPGELTRTNLVLRVRRYGLVKHSQDLGGAAGKLVNRLVQEGAIEFRRNPDDAVRDAFFGHDKKPKAYLK